MSKLLLVYLALLVISIHSSGQNQSEVNFTPCTHYDQHADALKDQVVLAWEKKPGSLSVARPDGRPFIPGKEESARQSNRQKSVYIRHYSRSYCNEVLGKLVAHNTLASIQRHVLVHQTPVPNAACIGQGSYMVSIGLPAQLENENQLAFVLAHEIAHDELNHINQNIQTEIELNLAKQMRTSVTHVLTSNQADEGDMAQIRKLLYQVGSFSQAKEYEADELALELIANAHYEEEPAITILNRLSPGASLVPKANADMFFVLESPGYPIQSHWFNDRLHIYQKAPTPDYYVSDDSIRSHPRDSLRVLRLASSLTSQESGELRSLPNGIPQHILFEGFEGAFLTMSYDKAITLGLYLLQQHPRNSYLISRITLMLSKLYEARSNQTFDNYVPLFTADYAEELLLTNNLLHNITTKELGDLAYHFIANPHHFNAEKEDH